MDASFLHIFGFIGLSNARSSQWQEEKMTPTAVYGRAESQNLSTEVV